MALGECRLEINEKILFNSILLLLFPLFLSFFGSGLEVISVCVFSADIFRILVFISGPCQFFNLILPSSLSYAPSLSLATAKEQTVLIIKLRSIS